MANQRASNLAQNLSAGDITRPAASEQAKRTRLRLAESNCQTTTTMRETRTKNLETNHHRTPRGQESICCSNWRTTRNLSKISFKFLLFALMLAELRNHGIVSHHEPSSITLTPNILLAAGATIECSTSDDCQADRVCHENKCICSKDRPVEYQERCLNLALIDEQCSISEQCMGNSACLLGVCSCGPESVSLFNPSARIFYCHPKRKLNEECNHDLQCPSNSFCSTKKHGCLCQNGFGPANVESQPGSESQECLAKACGSTRDCESEFHHCDEGKCKCLATHFDPTTASCYKFGSTGGKSLDDLIAPNNATSGGDLEDSFRSIIKDLTENSDKMWIVIIILILLTLLVFLIIFMLLRKHYLGYCWTAHKKEYEPNNKNAQAKNDHFDKDSINNKSFRRKSGELEYVNDDDETAELTPGGNPAKSGRNSKKQSAHVKVNMNGKKSINGKNSQNDPNQSDLVISPLASSTSTPV